MLRLIIVILLPLIVPFLIYAVVAWLLLRRRAAAAGRPPPDRLDWRAAPVVWLLAVGVCGALAGLGHLYFSKGYSPDTKLVPPAVVDGVLVPSHPLN